MVASRQKFLEREAVAYRERDKATIGLLCRKACDLTSGAGIVMGHMRVCRYWGQAYGVSDVVAAFMAEVCDTRLGGSFGLSPILQHLTIMR